ncbi:MAG: DUF1269 domain-containing protein [Bosea sp.]|jgi:uncharacterized membrane protein|nr:DUF1269 domain-containing protein [Bosea sp. (in: a-proteobacteria)]
MKTLFAITYPATTSARAALQDVQAMQKGATISLIDAVLVTRTSDGAVKLEQSVNTTAIGALSGAMWGSLIGLLFLNPLLGAAVGATAGALSGYATDYGISDEFMNTIGQRLAGHTTTLFILAAELTPDKVAAALARHGGDIAYTSMPDDIEERFRSRFEPGGRATADALTPHSAPAMTATDP